MRGQRQPSQSPARARVGDRDPRREPSAGARSQTGITTRRPAPTSRDGYQLKEVASMVIW
jgi:hypothetical protein